LIPSRPVGLDAEASVGTVQSCIRAKKPYAYLVNIAAAQHERARARRFSEELTAAEQTVGPVIVDSGSLCLMRSKKAVARLRRNLKAKALASSRRCSHG
jgi:hypothetical protein